MAPFQSCLLGPRRAGSAPLRQSRALALTAKGLRGAPRHVLNLCRWGS